jgi:hypothetical protein
MKKLTNKQKIKFFTARQRRGDVIKIADLTWYSEGHISNVLNGKRSLNDVIANAAYKISYRRKRNSELMTR